VDGIEPVATFSSQQARYGKALRSAIPAAIFVFLFIQIARTLPASQQPARHPRPGAAVSGGDTVLHVYMAIAAALALLFLVATVRSFFAGFTLDARGVTVRAPLSTRRWRWDEIRSASVQDRSRTPRAYVGLASQRSFSEPKILVLPKLHLTSGKTVLLYTARISLEDPTSENWVDEAVREINRRLEARREGRGYAQVITP